MLGHALIARTDAINVINAKARLMIFWINVNILIKDIWPIYIGPGQNILNRDIYISTSVVLSLITLMWVLT